MSPKTGRWFAFLQLALTGAACAREASSSPRPDGARADAASTGFAVVELFTSEGCSSCPPADEALRELTRDAERDGLLVFALAYHVDYWDSLGWRDRSGAAFATARQQAYADALQQRGMYTPEIVVNGRDAFVGSDRARLRRSVQSALGRGAGAPIAVGAAFSSEGLAVEITLASPPDARAELRVAVVEHAIATEVTAGENAGTLLRHVNVVRAYQSVRLEGAQRARALFNGATHPKASTRSVIAILQDPATMAVLGAARLRL